MFRFFRSAATQAALLLGAVALGLVLHAWHLPPFASPVETTDNAYVRGRVTFLAPQLAGYVAEVAVRDYQSVARGDLLVRLDDRSFRQKVDQAAATLAAQQAALDNLEQSRLSAAANVRAAEARLEGAAAGLRVAQANWERIAPLVDKGVTTRADADATRAALDAAQATRAQAEAALEVSRQDLQAMAGRREAAEAAVAGARAALELARIDLENTRILAPGDGRVGEVGARPGQYVAAGTQLMALVPGQVWVIANFKETQVEAMRIGQPAEIRVDALGHAPLSGRVQGFSPATGSEFSVLKADNATGNFTKVAQRLPVRILLDPGQPGLDPQGAARLVPGLSVEVSIDTSAPADPAALPADPATALQMPADPQAEAAAG